MVDKNLKYLKIMVEKLWVDKLKGEKSIIIQTREMNMKNEIEKPVLSHPAVQ